MLKARWMVLLIFAMAACSGNSPSGIDPGKSENTAPAESEGVGGGPANSSASCVELYSPETLKNRQIALDGVVKSVVSGNLPGEGAEPAPPVSLVTFQVNKWYKGGSGSEAVLKSSTPSSPAISSAGNLSLEVGKRYLVSGDGGFAWSCGFSTPFSEATEMEWSTALD